MVRLPMALWPGLLLLFDSVVVHGVVIFPLRRAQGQPRRDLLALLNAQPHRLPQGGADYFFTTVQIGTPLQPFNVILDTGSNLMFIPCNNTCINCGRHTHAGHYLQSSSLTPIGCSADLCSSAAGLQSTLCDEGTCGYHISYQEGSGVKGLLMADDLAIGQGTMRVNFGCSQSETGLLNTQAADGVMGLGRGQLALPNQLHEVSSGVFSLCLSGAWDGAVAFGMFPLPAGMTWTPLLSQSLGVTRNWYRVETTAIQVGSYQLPLSTSDFVSNKYRGTVVDSGCTDLLLPSSVFQAVMMELKKRVPGKSDSYGPGGNLCLPATDEIWKALPLITLTMQGDCPLVLSPINYVTQEGDEFCLNIFDNGDRGLIIGSRAIMDKLVVFDTLNERIGFVDYNCSNLRLMNSTQNWPMPSSATPHHVDDSQPYLRPALIILSLVPVVLLAAATFAYLTCGSFVGAYSAMNEERPAGDVELVNLNDPEVTEEGEA